MDKTGTWRLSPAYDMSWAYSTRGIWTQNHQMSINNKYDAITRDDLLKVAYEMNIKKAPKIIDQVVDAVAQWPTLAREHSEIPQATIDYIEQTRGYV